METTPFELTPNQKALLQALSREAGMPIPARLDEVLCGLQAWVRTASASGKSSGSGHAKGLASAKAVRSIIWERFEAAGLEIPDDELGHLPIDGSL